MGQISIQPKISAMQLCLLFIANRVAIMTVFLPGSGIKNAWISALLSGCGGLLLTWMIVKLAQYYPNQTLVQICITLLGKWVGGVFVFLFLWFFLDISTIIIRQFAEIITTAIMPETPLAFFIIFIVIAVIFAVHRGMEAILRTNAIMLPVSLASILILLVLVRKEISFDALKPLFEDKWISIFENSVVSLAWFGEIIILPMFFPYVQDKNKVLSYSLYSVLISTTFLVLLVITVIGVFGVEEANNLTLPVFSLVRMVSVANFLERIEAVMVAVWISLLYTKISIYLYAGVIGVGQWLHLKSYRFLIIPMALIAVVLTYTSFESMADIKHFISPINWGIIGIFIGFILPTILFIIASFKRRK